MDKETKDYFENILKGMATKDDMAEIKKEMVTKTEFSRLERKNDKAHKELLDYVAHIDSEQREHRQNSEMHVKTAANF